MVKVRYTNGFETQQRDEIAKINEKKGYVEILKAKPGPKPKSEKKETKGKDNETS